MSISASAGRVMFGNPQVERDRTTICDFNLASYSLHGASRRHLSLLSFSSPSRPSSESKPCTKRTCSVDELLSRQETRVTPLNELYLNHCMMVSLAKFTGSWMSTANAEQLTCYELSPGLNIFHYHFPYKKVPTD